MERPRSAPRPRALLRPVQARHDGPHRAARRRHHVPPAVVAFLILTLLGLGTWLARSVSPSMKYSFGAGIGLFLLLIGMYETGIITSSVTGMDPTQLKTAAGRLLPPATPLKLGNLHDTH